MLEYKSIALQTDWPSYCATLAEKPELWAAFRANPAVRSMVETVSQAAGNVLADIILYQSPKLIQFKEKFRTSDSIGSPQTFLFGKWGQFSPTTLRYIKVLSDLENIFGSLDGVRIVEIGAGYGGQAKILFDLFKIKKYVIYDLPVCLPVIHKYLNHFNITDIELRSDPNIKVTEGFDLFISNYAYTELEAALQMLYKQNVIDFATRGYIAANFISKSWNVQSLSAEQLAALFPSMQKLKEIPSTREGNFIVAFEQAAHLNSTTAQNIKRLKRKHFYFQFYLKLYHRAFSARWSDFWD